MSPVSYAKMELSMRHSLTNFEPRATITAVEIDGANIDSNSISINIEFTILSGSQSSSVPDSLKIEIKKVR